MSKEISRLFILLLFLFNTTLFAEEIQTKPTFDGYFQLKTNSYFSHSDTSFRTLEVPRSEIGVSYKLFSDIDSFVSVGNDEMSKEGYITIKDIKIDFTFSPLFILTLGLYKSPFSYELLTPETKLDFIDRSLSTKIFGPERTIGVQIAGKTGFFGYAFKLSNKDSMFYDKEDCINGRIIFDFTDWFHFAISEYYGIFYDYKKLYRITSAGELVFDFSPFVFKAEYLHGYPDSNLYRISYSSFDNYAEGWYSQICYKLSNELELLLKWDHLWGEYLARDRDEKIYMRRIITNYYAYGINYYLNKNSKLQFNYISESLSNHEFKFLFQNIFDIKI